jgi:hypothetical protein
MPGTEKVIAFSQLAVKGLMSFPVGLRYSHLSVVGEREELVEDNSW